MELKKILMSLTIFTSVLLLAACSSAEADEVLDYHNDLVDYVNPLMEELEEMNAELFRITSEEDALAMQKNEILPVLDDILGYIESREPEYEVTKDYHDLLLNWIQSFSEGVYLETEAFEGLLDGSLSEDEAWELFMLSGEAVQESIKYDDQARKMWEDIKEEYNFEDLEE